MKKNQSTLPLLLLLILSVLTALTGCNKIKTVKELSEKIQGDRLYFCERYVTKEINKGNKFKAGKVTVRVKLSNPIGESSVDINITDAASGKVVDTVPFNVQSSWDYIHFDNVEFKDPGKYKVSCLKKDGSVIASGEVEII
jgi:hypothetical protein